MEVGRVGSTRISKTEERRTLSGRKGFAQSFKQEREKKSQEQLKQMCDDIKKKGNRLVLTKTYADVRIYKKMIKEYLESVLQYMYDTFYFFLHDIFLFS